MKTRARLKYPANPRRPTSRPKQPSPHRTNNPSRQPPRRQPPPPPPPPPPTGDEGKVIGRVRQSSDKGHTCSHAPIAAREPNPPPVGTPQPKCTPPRL